MIEKKICKGCKNIFVRKFRENKRDFNEKVHCTLECYNQHRISWNKGLSKEINSSLRNISDKMMGKQNHHWNQNIGYGGIHKWVLRNSNIPLYCEKCNKIKRLDIANISGEYKRDLNDWEWLCRKCHMVEDGRLNKIITALENFRKRKNEVLV